MKTNLLKILFVFMLSIESIFALNIDYLHQLVLKNNKALISSKYEQDAQKQEKQKAKANFYPSLQGIVGYTNRKYTLNGSGIKEQEKYNSYKLSLSQTIYDQRAYDGLKEANLIIDSSKKTHHQSKQEIILEATELFIDGLIVQEKLKLFEKNLSYSKKKQQQLEKMFQHSLVDIATYNKHLLEHNTLKVEQNKLKNQLKLILEKISSKTSSKVSKLEYDFSQKDFVFNLSKTNTTQVLKLQLLQKELELEKHRLKASSSQHYPSLTLQGDYTKFESDDDINDYTKDKKLMLTLKIPIFNGFYYTSQTKQQQLQVKAKQSKLYEEKNNIENLISELSNQRDFYKENIIILKSSFIHTKNYLDSILKSFNKGLKNSVDLEEARYLYAKIDFEIKENRLEKLKNEYKLKYIFFN